MSVTSISRVLHASTARVRERGVDLEPTVDQLATVDATVDTAVAGGARSDERVTDQSDSTQRNYAMTHNHNANTSTPGSATAPPGKRCSPASDVR
jgi:hypothetical protein